MSNQDELFNQDTEETTESAPATDRVAPSLLGSLAPIMQPESLARIEANWREWLSRQAWYREKNRD
jgi:hypothetical protein